MLAIRARLYLSKAFVVLLALTLVAGTSAWNVHVMFDSKLASVLFESGMLLMGVGLVCAGAFGRVWSLAHIAGHKSERLITSGPYSMCRNPLYFFSFLFAVGLGFCTETLTIPLVVGAAFLGISYLAIRREEAVLSGVFGEKFEAYVAAAPRFFPSLRNYHESQMISISPKILRAGIVQTAAIIPLICLFEVLEDLHLADLIPTWFLLY